MALSALLHAAVAGALIWWLRDVRHEPEPHPIMIFEMPAFETPTIEPTTHVASTAAPTVNFTPVPVMPRVREPEADPEVSPRPQVVARPTAAAPRPTASRPAPTPAPRRQRTAVQESVRPSSAPRINMEEVLAAAGPPGVPTSMPAVSSPEATMDYFARLTERLRAAHEKPEGLDDGLRARVEFVLRADGTVSAVRILQSSGSEAFDTSVLAAFRRLRDLGVPPAGLIGINQVTFRTQAD
ncbi:MAG TPA: TonB family protein [Rariglobus sp.]